MNDHLQIGQHVADFLAIVKRHAADQRVGNLRARNSVSKGRGCSLVRNRMAMSRGSTDLVSIKRANFLDYLLGFDGLVWELQIRGSSPAGRKARSTLSCRCVL